MNLSKRGEYAIRVLLDLAMAAERGRSLHSLAALAEAQRIPQAFLEQILLNLRQGGFLNSTRGKHGGYSLSRRASEILMDDLIVFLEGPLVSTGCVSGSAAAALCNCPDPQRCGLRLLMTRVRDALFGVMKGLTLAELARETFAVFLKDGLLPPILRDGSVPGTSEGKRRKRGGEAEPEYLI